MKKPLKVALYSGLLFPGIGHFMLKKYFRGLILFSSFAISTYIYFTDAMAKANEVIQQVQKGEISLDTTAIEAALSNISTGLSQQQLSLLGYFMMFIWLVGIIDAYRMAKYVAK
jgi:hypothetical protein